MDLFKFGTNESANENSGFTLPGLENIQTMFATLTTALIAFVVVFGILYIVNLVQRIRADRAMIAMQKDIAAIRSLLQTQVAPSHPSTNPTLPPEQTSGI